MLPFLFGNKILVTDSIDRVSIWLLIFSLSSSVYCRVARPWHCWHFGLDNFLLLGTVLCFVGYWMASLGFPHYAISIPGCDNQKCFEVFPNVPAGSKLPLPEDHDHDLYNHNTRLIASVWEFKELLYANSSDHCLAYRKFSMLVFPIIVHFSRLRYQSLSSEWEECLHLLPDQPHLDVTW